jgi:ABC-2 type transport system ATP-binding protein
MHDLDDIEEICQRLVIIDRGRKIFDGDLQTVRDRFARERAIGLLTPLQQRIADSDAGITAALCGMTTVSTGSPAAKTAFFDRFAA